MRDRIVNQELRLPKDTPCTDECADMFKGLLCKDPSKRFDMTMIKTHKWLLLSDSAITLKVELSMQNAERELEKRRIIEEQKKVAHLGPLMKPAASLMEVPA